MKILEKKEYKKIHDMVEKEKKDIDRLLEKNKCKEACQLLDRQEMMILSGKDPDLFVLQIMKNIQKKENDMGKNGVFYNRNVRELVDIYDQLIIFLRRIEFGLPEEYQNELLYYMKEKQISRVCVVGVISGAPYILEKEKVTDLFLKMLDID